MSRKDSFSKSLPQHLQVPHNFQHIVPQIQSSHNSPHQHAPNQFMPLDSAFANQLPLGMIHSPHQGVDTESSFQTSQSLGAEALQQASRHSNEVSIPEDKRQRNTAASARFRIKKKQRALELELTVSDLTCRAAELEREATNLRRENTWLKEIVILKGRQNFPGSTQNSGGADSPARIGSDSFAEEARGFQKPSDNRSKEGCSSKKHERRKGRGKPEKKL